MEDFKFLKCFNCGKIEDIQLCCKCRAIGYCNTICQKQDWSKHKLICTKAKLEREKLELKKNMMIMQKIY